MNLEDHIAKNPELWGDIIGPLWQSVTYKGARYGVPQDSEVRMFFLNNDKLRKMGMSDKDIAALPAKVNAGEFTANDLCDLAGQAVQKGVAKYGILHRPNAGPDFQMLIEAFGIEPYDKSAAKLQTSKAGLRSFFTWVKYCVDKKALSANNTAMSWDAIEQASFGGEEALVFFHGVWRVTDQMKAWNLKGKDDYFHKITWINGPAGKKGGTPTNLSHPIAYAVSAKSKNKELAAYIVALASQPVPNLRHAVTTNHTPINYGEQSMPEIVDKGWALVAATPMLKYASFMPNHPKIGQYNSILFKGIQGVETGRLTPQAAADFVVGELENELGKDVIIRNCDGGGRNEPTDYGHARFRAGPAPPPARQLRAVPGPGADPARVLLHRAGRRRPGARVHGHGPHAEGDRVHVRQLRADGDARLAAARVARHHGDLRARDAVHLQRDVRAAAGARHDGGAQGPGRVLPGDLAAAADEPVGRLRAAVAVGRRSRTSAGLLNQVLVNVLGMAPVDLRNNHPLLVIILANGFIGASLGMIIFTSAIRSIPVHLFHAARADGAGALAIVRHIVFPAMRWPISYMTIHQTLSLLVSFEYILLITGGGPFYDTTVFSLYAYRRAFENGQYAYGAALSLILIVVGVIAALAMWRLMDMRRLLQPPRIEVQ